jgi:hypothetical protein
LDRVLQSETFARAAQLKKFLEYVCTMEMADRVSEISEYSIAVEALGRHVDYSPGNDSTVRGRAHDLRLKLELFYSSECPGEGIRITFPRGTYVPLFLPAAHPEPPLDPIHAAPAEVHTPSPWNRPVPIGPVCIVLVLAVLLSARLGMKLQTTGAGTDPVIAAAWGPLLSKTANPLICISTAAQLTLIQRPPEPHTSPAVSAPDLMDWYRSLPGLPPAQGVYLGPSLTSPFWGDVAGALAVSHILNGAGITPEALPESAIQLPALNRRNLLMFGRPGFSKSIDLYLRDKPFRIPAPDEQHTTVIWNVTPKHGEPAEYNAHPPAGTGTAETEYGLITVMPSWGDGNLRSVIFSGTLSPATQAAAEFFSSAKQMQALLRLFRQEGYSNFPSAYQVVVRSNVFGTSALDVQYVTHRVISKSRD